MYIMKFSCNDICISCSFSLSRNVHRTEGMVETNEVCLNFCGQMYLKFSAVVVKHQPSDKIQKHEQLKAR